MKREIPRYAMVIVAAAIFAGVVIFAGHQFDKTSRKHSDYNACIKYNELAFAVNRFHRSVAKFIGTARDARVSEAEVLKGMSSETAQKLRERDLQVAKTYQAILDNASTVRYEENCPINKKAVVLVEKKKQPRR